MKHVFSIFLVFISFATFAQETSYTSVDIPISKFIDGTLLKPNKGSSTLAIIIADSGPIDRDGNQDFQKTNNLKKLAAGLTNRGIATFRYDKRIVKQLRRGNLDPNIKFENFVNDAIDVIDYFRKQNDYKKIYIIGHSQGSLIGMLAAKEKADGFISIAGAGKSIDAVILEQVELTAPMFTEDTKRIVAVLKDGKTTNEYPQALNSIFDLSVQPFMASWMKYNPIEEIKKLDIPVLVINGTKDLQVSVEEATSLSKAGKKSELKLIKQMNHVLFLITGDDQENAKSYNESFRPISPELIESIVTYIESNR
jgi:hypothetical protein